jgi:hypothetical protein
LIFYGYKNGWIFIDTCEWDEHYYIRIYRWAVN